MELKCGSDAPRIARRIFGCISCGSHSTPLRETAPRKSRFVALRARRVTKYFSF